MNEYTTDDLIALFDTILTNNAKPDTNGEHEWPTPLVDWVAAYGLAEDPARWLAEPIIPDGGSVAIFAKGGTGKSLLALWIAAGLATGAAPVEVLYLDYEMTIATVVARLEDMGYADPLTLGHLHYASLPTLAALDTKEGGRDVVAMARRLDARLVVIDTFGRAVDGAEDLADTVRAWYRWTGQLLKTAGISFLRIDHAGKDLKRGQRGSSAKNDDVDVVWEMTERGHGEFLLRATKRRVAWVDERVVVRRTHDDGVLGYRWDSTVTYLAGAKECAELLDTLDAPVDISRRKAMALLRDAGEGRANNVVADALRWRRGRLSTGFAYQSNAGVRTEGVRNPRTETNPQEYGGEYQAVPAEQPDERGRDTYVVRAPVQAIPGLFDPSTDPDRDDQ